jgi:hypothetical protein
MAMRKNGAVGSSTSLKLEALRVRQPSYDVPAKDQIDRTTFAMVARSLPGRGFPAQGESYIIYNTRTVTGRVSRVSADPGPGS